jgi:hypothetical protein
MRLLHRKKNESQFQQTKWWMIKLKRKKFKKQKEIGSSMSVLWHMWILKTTSFEGTKHENFLLSGFSKNQTKSIT